MENEAGPHSGCGSCLGDGQGEGLTGISCGFHPRVAGGLLTPFLGRSIQGKGPWGEKGDLSGHPWQLWVRVNLEPDYLCPLAKQPIFSSLEVTIGVQAASPWEVKQRQVPAWSLRGGCRATHPLTAPRFSHAWVSVCFILFKRNQKGRIATL